MHAEEDADERQAVGPSVFLRAAPYEDAEAVGQLLFGERLLVVDGRDGWVEGRGVRDGCLGWLEDKALGPCLAPTHWVRRLRTVARSGPGLTASDAPPIPMNALLRIDAVERGWLRDPRAGWFAEDDLAPMGLGFEMDSAGVAERLLGTPYRQGSRDGLGLDAVGLVQQARLACGLSAPRALPELARLGRAVAEGEALRRGDLALWPDHVGLVLDSMRLIHADPAVGAVITPIEAVSARWGRSPAIRRDHPLSLPRA